MTDDGSAHDWLYPRTPEYRYRLYFRTGERDLDAPVATPTMGGIGVAIGQMHEDMKSVGRRLADLGVVGVLDAVEREWIVLPWERPEEPVTFGKKPRRVKT